MSTCRTRWRGAVARSSGAARGLTGTTAVHICYGYGIQANLDWKRSLGDEWRQYEQVFPALAAKFDRPGQPRCIHSHVPIELMALLEDKDVMVGVIDVASDVVETPGGGGRHDRPRARFVRRDRLLPAQLRPRADGARRRRGQARSWRARRGAAQRRRYA